ncbi:Terminase [Leuconostoc gasicomitatum]|uniref:terminase small subunit n=1 Tax=Leuconostoc gasicomitatum TaxID=115778 RepID=UPI000BDC1C1C|nr:terminase small subunit [Leuconostoc gasicomitatum]MBZ5967267.1 terminase small subunit [Leuconostoc gasicomitatum]QFS15362.1 terminase [Leuconostoc gasicomitatum]SOB97846.1 Terminase small subunit [Leuconostoc gasicomitatum]
MKLTPKQKKFADEYIKTGNATQSAIEAGYSKKTAQVIGAENLSKPMVKSYIEERMAEIASKRVMSYTEAVELLTSIARGEEKETVVVATPVSVEKVEKEADLKTRISALKEILKRYPNNDKLVEQQIRKLSAEADIAQKKAELLSGNNSDINININPFEEDI